MTDNCILRPKGLTPGQLKLWERAVKAQGLKPVDSCKTQGKKTAKTKKGDKE